MVDLSKPPDEKTVEKIAWYLMGPVKFVVVYLIFFGCFVSGALFFQYIHQFVSFEIAIVSSFVIFFGLAIVLLMLINKYRLVERLTEDQFQK